MNRKPGGYREYVTCRLSDQVYSMCVHRKVRSKEVVAEADWTDFVFEEDYDLSTLDEEVETFIQANGHLLGIPSEEEVTEEGYRRRSYPIEVVAED